MNLASKMGFGFGIIILSTFIFGIYLLVILTSINKQFSFVVKHDALVIANARQLEKLVVDMETGQRGFCITKDDKFLEPYNTGITKFEILIKKEKELVSDNPPQVKRLEEIGALVEEWREKAAIPEIAMAREAREVMNESPETYKNLVALIQKGTGKNILDQVRKEFNEFIKEERILTARRYSRASTTANHTINTTIMLIIFLIVFGGSIAVFITRGITMPIAHLADVTIEIGKGKLDTKIDIESKDEIGSLAESFNKMRISLQAKEENLLQQTKLKTAISELNDQMRGDLELVDLGKKILSYLVPQLNAQIGALYLMERDNLLKLISSYAYVEQKEQKNLLHEFKLGESLVGQAVVDKEAKILTKVPEGYFDISTASGGIVPRNIFILPLQYEGIVRGVIELGSVNEFSDKEMDFLNQVAGNIAISIHLAQSRKRMQDLLEESQMQAEELQSREEEMLATNEELAEKIKYADI